MEDRTLKNAFLAISFLFIFLPLSSQQADSVRNPLSQTLDAPSPGAITSPATIPSALLGVWENASRFVEFTSDAKMRIVLKPYYGFVYEDTGAIPCTAVRYSSAASGAAAGQIQSSPVYRLSVRYTGEKTDALVPLAILGDGLYFRFFTRLASVPASTAAASASTAAPSPIGSTTTPASPATATTAPATTTTAPATPASPATATTAPATTGASGLDGFWLAAGNADGLRLYKSGETDEFFSYYFSGKNYWRIRYWKTDARFRDVNARFETSAGNPVEIPKFITMGELLYTCITSTGTTLRNYEKGTVTVADGKISFKPANVVYAGTAADYRNPVSYALSSDGSVLALGSPWLTRSKVAGLDAEIKAHNGLTRPPRKPVFGYMDLDFHWDEVDQIRGGATDSTAK